MSAGSRGRAWEWGAEEEEGKREDKERRGQALSCVTRKGSEVAA